MVSRTLKPELLDALSPDDRDAIHSRRDLRHFNRAMGNPAWFRKILPQIVQPGERVLELGAGTGELRKSLPLEVFHWDGLDLAPRPSDWPENSQWFQTDVRAFRGWSDYPVVIANLFLHHLDDTSLVDLGTRIRIRARAVVFSEPGRARRWQWAFRALCLVVGANHVSRHDGRVSIAAGFRGDELPRSLGLCDDHWACTHSTSIRGVYRLAATRISL